MLRRDRLAALLKADPEAADARDLRALLERLAEHGVRGVVVREHLHWIPWRDPGRPRPPAPGACVFAPSSVLVTPGPDLPLVANPLKRRRKRLVAIVPRIASEASGAVFTFALQILGRLGWQITAVALHAGEEGAETALARLTPDLHVLERAVHPEEWPRQLRGLLESRRPEIVLFDGARLPPALLFHLRAHVPETRYVALHHLDPDEPPAHGTARPLGAPDGADVTLASGIEPAADEHSGSLLWLPICVDTQVWQPRAGPRGWLRPNWGAGEDDAVILFVGSLADRDRLDRVLRSLAGLRERSVGFVAVIAGEGSEASGLASEIAKRGLSDCVRVPPDGSQDVLRAMAAADVFFSPGRTGFAIRFVQAMAMELPVVAADAAGRRALVTGECGRLVAPGAGEISGYVDALATLAADPSLRRDLGREARRRVLLRFGPDRLAQQLEAAFRDAVPRAADPSPTPALHLAAVEASRRAADHEALGRCAARLARESAALAAQRAALAGDLDRERAERSALEARQAELARAFEQRGRELREAKESLEALRGAPAALAGHPAGQDERLPLARDRQGFAARWWRPRRLARRVSGIARSLGRLDGGERTP
jgi:glycosyltransferase involved in cell wall biosynthesis